MSEPRSGATEERERYMRAYYHQFTPTGCDAVDAILEAIAVAGKAYHSTSEWSEPTEYGKNEGPCHWDAIQAAADKAASVMRSETASRDDAIALADEAISKAISWIGGFICSGPGQETRKAGMVQECRAALEAIRAITKSSQEDMNTGHGHVRPRPDGVKARCGGPGFCVECSRELAAEKFALPTETAPRKCVWSHDSADDDAIYLTGCNRNIVYSEGTRTDCDVKFCQYCGGEVEGAR